jgi:hypothetical protein
MLRKLLTIAFLIAFAVTVRLVLVAQDSHKEHRDAPAPSDAPAVELDSPLLPEPELYPHSRETEADKMVRSMVKKFEDGNQKMKSGESFDPFAVGQGQADSSAPKLADPKPIRNTRERKDRFLKLARDYADLNNMADIDSLTGDLEKRIAEESARQKVAEIESLLKFVTTKFANTEGARRAQRMLDAAAQPAATQQGPQDSPEVSHVQPAEATRPAEPVDPPTAQDSPEPGPDAPALPTDPEPALQ